MEFTIPTTIPLQAYLALAAVLFCTGVWGLINSRNAVRVLMSIELMLNAVNINLMAFSSYIDGQLIRGLQRIAEPRPKRKNGNCRAFAQDTALLCVCAQIGELRFECV